MPLTVLRAQDIILYTAGTPNGQKVSITLEELGLQYETQKVDISKDVQKEDWYLRINRRHPRFHLSLPACSLALPTTETKPNLVL